MASSTTSSSTSASSVPSTSMNEEEAAALYLVGISLIEDIYSVILETFYWSINAVLFAVALYILYSRGRRNWSTFGMVAAVFVLFGSCTSIYGLEVGLMIARYRARLVLNQTWAIQARNTWVLSSFKDLGVGMEVLWLMNMLIGDAVVLWRAWILWPGRQIVLILPLAFLAGTFSFAVIAITCLVQDSFGSLSRVVNSSSRTCSWAEPTAWAMSLCTNIVSTTLIGIKAWHHRQLLKRHFEVRPKKSQAQKALMLLIESGAIYCILWLLQIVGFFSFKRTESRFYIYGAITPLGEQLSGIYPTAIIALVALQQTVYAHTMYQPHTGANGTIEFAPSPVRTATSNTRNNLSSQNDDLTGTGTSFAIDYKDDVPVSFADRSSVGKVPTGPVEPDPPSFIPLKSMTSSN